MIAKFIRRLLGASLLALATGVVPATAEPDRLDIPLLWGSTRGVLHVTTSSFNGTFAGQYDSTSFGCPGLFNVAGKLAYNRVVFSVHFDRCGTFVSWNGKVQPTRLVMEYRLVYTDPVSGRRVITRGHDILDRLPDPPPPPRPLFELPDMPPFWGPYSSSSSSSAGF